MPQRHLSALWRNFSLVYHSQFASSHDILVPGCTSEEHIKNLRVVLLRLREAKLKLSPKKCILFQRQVKFLGHIVSKDGVATDPEKLQAVRAWPRSSNVSETRRFLGLCSYYRRYVPNFAELAHPLHQSTEKMQVFNWNDDMEKSFGPSPLLSRSRSTLNARYRCKCRSSELRSCISCTTLKHRDTWGYRRP